MSLPIARQPIIQQSLDNTVELPDIPGHSLFVANLPLRMTNHELAWALHQAFRPFGPLRLIRASRDQSGRPFGFVDFQADFDGNVFHVPITIGGRQVRVERARFQARLIITPPIMDLCDGLITGSGDLIKMQQDPARTQLQFASREMAVKVLKYLMANCDLSQHSLTWLLPGQHSFGMQSLVRSSGLVQLAPDGSDLMAAVKRPQVQSNIMTFEEEEYEVADANIANIANNEVYVGRLCSWRVTRDLLRERFARFGQILYIRLFNRGVVRPDSPVDAFAHIGFESDAVASKAIESENGECWLGQVITVQPLLKGKAQRLQAAARLLNNHIN